MKGRGNEKEDLEHTNKNGCIHFEAIKHASRAHTQLTRNWVKSWHMMRRGRSHRDRRQQSTFADSRRLL